MIKSTKLSWIVVSDIKKAKEFYVDTLGLKLLEHSPEYCWMELGTEEGDYRLGVAEYNEEHGKDDKPGMNAVMTFDVENIEMEIETLKKKDVKFIGQLMEVPGHVKMITFLDKDGNKFQLCQHISCGCEH